MPQKDQPLTLTADGVIIHCPDDQLGNMLDKKHVLDRPEDNYYWIKERYKQILRKRLRNI